MKRASSPAGRLLVVFDLFDEWFHRDDYEGCAFVTALLEYRDPGSPIRRASVGQLMKGTIVSASEGDREAARRARELGELLLRQHGVLS